MTQTPKALPFCDFASTEKCGNLGCVQCYPKCYTEADLEEAKSQTAQAIKKEVEELQEFLEADLWQAIHHKTELITEKKLQAYLQRHFDVVRKEIANLEGKK